jgi:hypothetical protein
VYRYAVNVDENRFGAHFGHTKMNRKDTFGLSCWREGEVRRRALQRTPLDPPDPPDPLEPPDPPDPPDPWYGR